MEKRLVVFVLLTTLTLFGYELMRAKFAPRPVVEDDAAAEVEAEPDLDPLAEEARPDAQEPAIREPAQELPIDESEDRQPPAQLVEQELSQTWHSLGTYDGSDGPLLVILNSRGAAIERIELVERTDKGQLRYRDLEKKNGYMGPLGLVAVPGRGCRVHVVPDGTPAAMARPQSENTGAGLLVGDVITMMTRVDKESESAVNTLLPVDVSTLLGRTRPGDVVSLTVEREQAGQTTSLSFDVTLDVRPFQMIQPEPLSPTELEPHPLSCLFSLTKIGEQQIDATGAGSPRDANWEAKLLDGDRPGIEFRFPMDASQLPAADTAAELELIKRYRLGNGLDGKSPYHLDLEVAIRNRGAKEQRVAYLLDGPNGLPLEGWWYAYKTHPKMLKSAGARDIYISTRSDPQRLIGCSAIRTEASKNPDQPATVLFGEGESETVRFIAVDTQYFVSALIPQAEESGQPFARAEAIPLGELKPKRLMKTTNVSFRLGSVEIPIAPGDVYTDKFVLFAGPKNPELVAEYGIQETIYYGWFGRVARPLSFVLHFFNRILGNYGLAIVMLTVLVRGCMFPLGRKAAKNAAMMQELAPEMKAIAEKYKNDMEKRAKAQQELFRRHNYNPLGGCWPMFLQLPIFIGLYRCLSVDIELRQAALIPGIDWCSNLAGPDQLFYWGGGFSPFGLLDEAGMLGPYFNIFPICTIVLFLAHQKLFTPPATDDQTRMQLQVMKFMTLFIGIMFFKVASGLCLYFIASSLWGIAERKLLPKPTKVPPGSQPSKPAPKPRAANRPNTNGASGKGNAKRKRAKRR